MRITIALAALLFSSFVAVTHGNAAPAPDASVPNEFRWTVSGYTLDMHPVPVPVKHRVHATLCPANYHLNVKAHACDLDKR